VFFYQQKIARNKLHYFLLVITLLTTATFFYKLSSPDAIKLTTQQTESIGKKIWLNEGAGKPENLIIWNKNEAFPSLGIGHFIWFPKNTQLPFEESFPALLRHIQKKHALPAWLTPLSHAPWNNRNEFIDNIHSPKMQELRNLLENTIPLQVEFIIQRLEKALPKMLNSVSDESSKTHIKEQFYRVANHTNGPYALIDYVNFKGEGTSHKERYKNQGWGLLQVLHNMDKNNEEVMQEFVRSADFVLTRRVENADRDESHWLPGWRKRLETYKDT